MATDEDPLAKAMEQADCLIGLIKDEDELLFMDQPKNQDLSCTYALMHSRIEQHQGNTAAIMEKAVDLKKTLSIVKRAYKSKKTKKKEPTGKKAKATQKTVAAKKPTAEKKKSASGSKKHETKKTFLGIRVRGLKGQFRRR